MPIYNVDIEEERRLFYVGITRAIKILYLTGIHNTK
jgi:superfamily I DNA/RNA helicase